MRADAVPFSLAAQAQVSSHVASVLSQSVGAGGGVDGGGAGAYSVPVDSCPAAANMVVKVLWRLLSKNKQYPYSPCFSAVVIR